MLGSKCITLEEGGHGFDRTASVSVVVDRGKYSSGSTVSNLAPPFPNCLAPANQYMHQFPLLYKVHILVSDSVDGGKVLTMVLGIEKVLRIVII